MRKCYANRTEGVLFVQFLSAVSKEPSHFNLMWNTWHSLTNVVGSCFSSCGWLTVLLWNRHSTGLGVWRFEGLRVFTRFRCGFPLFWRDVVGLLTTAKDSFGCFVIRLNCDGKMGLQCFPLLSVSTVNLAKIAPSLIVEMLSCRVIT